MAGDQVVSVLLTTYNGAPHLAQQLDSLLGQSHSDLEIVAVDDGSTDHPPAILSEDAGRDDRIRPLLNAGNAGQRLRLLQAFNHSHGRYIAISDQDDLWHPDKIRILVEEIGNKALVFGRSQLIDAQSQDLGRSLLEAMQMEPETGNRLSALFRPMVSGHASLMRRDAFSTTTLQREACYFDHLMSLDAMYSGGVAYIDSAIVYHRLHGRNQVNGKVANTNSPRWRPWMVKWAFRVGQERRFTFLNVCDYLANSTVVSADARVVFRNVYRACHRAWLLAWRPAVSQPAKLTRYVSDQLNPYSGGPADAATFDRLFRQLCYLPPHPRALVTAVRGSIRGRDLF